MSFDFAVVTFNAAAKSQPKAAKADVVKFQFPPTPVAWVEWNEDDPSAPYPDGRHVWRKILAQNQFEVPKTLPVILQLKNAAVEHMDAIEKLKVCNIFTLDANKLDLQSKQVSGLRDFKSIVDCNLYSTPIDDNAIPIIANLPKIKHLRISHTAITGANFEQLNNLHQMVSLSASNLNLKPGSVAKLKTILPQMKFLDVGRTDLSDADVAVLAVAINLTDLDISYNTRVNDRTIRAIKDLNKLRTLHLETTAVTNKSLDMLAALPQLDEVTISPATFWRTANPVSKKGHTKFTDISSTEDTLDLLAPLH